MSRRGSYLGGSTIIRMPLVGLPKKASERSDPIAGTAVRPKGAGPEWDREQEEIRNDPEIAQRAAALTRARWAKQAEQEDKKLERRRVKKRKPRNKPKSRKQKR